MRKPFLVTIGVAAALIAGALSPGVTAHAVPSGDNVLRGWCASSGVPGAKYLTACVQNADDDSRVFVVRDSRGYLRHLRTQGAILRFMRHHSTPCKQEDSRRCYWDASVTGNGVGESFLSIGRGQGTWYVQDLAPRR